MKAMLLSAGKGTRLKPFTDDHPKCLARAGGATLLKHNIRFLKEAGVDSIVINTHHHSQQIIDYVSTHDFGLEIHISEEETLLETGGGILNAKEHFLDEEFFVVCNSDIYTNFKLKELIANHTLRNSMVTLAVADRKTARYLRFNDQAYLCGWENSETGEELSWNDDSYIRRAFNGYQVLSPNIFKYMEDRGSVFSTIPVYLAAAYAGEKVGAYEIDESYWIDIGTPENLESLKKHLENPA